MRHTVFSHLANRCGGSSENLATEALNFILGQSSAARQTFIEYLSNNIIELPKNLRFSSQVVGGDGSIPDMVGVDNENRKVLIIEAKFWAGLTGNQPVAYLEQLESDRNGILLFIAPEKRLPSLWAELLRRCKDSGKTVHQSGTCSGKLLLGSIDGGNSLALASWRSILSLIRGALEAEGETEVASDIRQLQGLCEQMDDDAFLPIHPEELAGNYGRRTYQYCTLVNDVTSTLVERGLVSTKGLTVGRTIEHYGRYMKIYEFACFLQVNLKFWSNIRETPLWLSVQGSDWKFSQAAKDCLADLEKEEPSRLFQTDNEVIVPLYLPTGVEKQRAIESLLEQVEAIVGILGKAQPQAT